jgi:hypothetical protein
MPLAHGGYKIVWDIHTVEVGIVEKGRQVGSIVIFTPYPTYIFFWLVEASGDMAITYMHRESFQRFPD